MTDPIRAGFDQLFADQAHCAGEAETKLSDYDSEYFSAYRRLIPLNAWREYLLAKDMGTDATAFFLEAQNDCLVSLLLARTGMWRPALQCLRGSIENVFSALYFKDHPVEYSLWMSNKFKIGFVDLKQYFSDHPRIATEDKALTGIDILGTQYRILSRAVHGAGLHFRMTQGLEVPIVYGFQKASVGRWLANQRAVLLGLNLLLACMYRDRIAGAAHATLRSVLGFAIPPATAKKMAAQWKVVLA
jgi:hypothetical protein